MANTARPGGVTRQIPRGEWKPFLERFTREHLREPPHTTTVEVLSPAMGDQLEARNQRLLGLNYDPKSDVLEVLLEGIDHLVFRPVELWVIESEDRFLSTLELVRPDGTRELLHLHRGGSPAPLRHPPSQRA
jgi:hypothetical protein